MLQYKSLTWMDQQLVRIQLWKIYQSSCTYVYVTGEDYASMPHTVIFEAGLTSVTFNISITDNGIFEGNESFTLDINSVFLPDDVTIGDPGQATVIIIDDDGKI